MEEKMRTVYEYCLLRYVPDIERGEFVNVGLMLMCKRYRWMRVEVHIDEARLQVLSPRCDVKRLRVQLGVFTRGDVPARDLPVEERYRWMAAVKSAVIQTSPSHPGLLLTSPETPAAEVRTSLDNLFDTLFSRLVK
ncbi:MAG: DUF3037 domain-containing protein [Muribaculaceae bacterium]|nr:DUF3037 domain-containing protein [Muribaculaceae bacterium]